MDSISGFTATYGRAPGVVWSAPGRVNLIGEHTDYNDGFVLPFAIGERTTVAAALRDDRDDDTIAVASSAFAGTIRCRLSEIAPGTVAGWAGYPLGVAWALAEHAGAHGRPQFAGADLFFDSTVPVGGGLSSSAALEMAAAGALAALWGLTLTAAGLARAGQRAENEIVGAPTGIMDQYASLLGEPDAAVFLDCRTRETRAVPLRLTEAGLALILADTREQHSHAAGGYAARRASCEKAAQQLGVAALRDLAPEDLPRVEAELDDETFRRVRHVVTENARVLAAEDALAAGDMPAVGKLLTASHRSMRDDYEITTPALDLAVEAAASAGAFGARMTGGGFGGSTITLIAADRVPALRSALADAFTAAGLPGPRVTTVAPSAGARQEA